MTAATDLPPAAAPAGPAAGEHTTEAAVIAAARSLAARYQHTPDWQERLTREAVALVEAVLAHDRTQR